MSEDERLDRALARMKPAIPDDAAERVLRALGPDAVAATLREGELELAARRALRWSGLLALLGAGAVAYVIAHDSGGVRFHWPLRHGFEHGHGHTPSAKDDGTFSFVSPDERRLLDPFPAKRN